MKRMLETQDKGPTIWKCKKCVERNPNTASRDGSKAVGGRQQNNHGGGGDANRRCFFYV